MQIQILKVHIAPKLIANQCDVITVVGAPVANHPFFLFCPLRINKGSTKIVNLWVTRVLWEAQHTHKCQQIPFTIPLSKRNTGAHGRCSENVSNGPSGEYADEEQIFNAQPPAHCALTHYLRKAL